MIFIIILKLALKEKNSYHKLKKKKKTFITNENDLKIKNLYEIEKFINKQIVRSQKRETRNKKSIIQYFIK